MLLPQVSEQNQPEVSADTAVAELRRNGGQILGLIYFVYVLKTDANTIMIYQYITCWQNFYKVDFNWLRKVETEAKVAKMNTKIFITYF